ncbi:FtsX-like permease family protein [Peptostreptococcus canis]|uniref:ABC transporter permease n=1 Tax=Peptostreptococcus canis TaxID=1159213 RepID=A0ABR6TI26_9FIRM|nr:ABC transporter permease [Peptostreptococcus canis]MBC2575074.1 ABC transporter permease [Peptostreptococcus canis]MBP1997753.1 putative ABC transport system permease protein [Peptostreptococcus canis]
MYTYFKLSKQYIKKNIKTYIIILVALTLTVFTISFPTVLKRSQANNKIRYIQEIAPKYDYLGINISTKNLSDLENSNLIKNMYAYDNLGSLSIGNNYATSLVGYNNILFDILKYDIVQGDFPKKDDEVILNKDTYIYGKKVNVGDKYNFFHEYRYKENGENKIISGNKTLKVVGIYKSLNSEELVKYLAKMGFNYNNAYTNAQSKIIPGDLKTYNVFINKINNKVKNYDISSSTNIEPMKIVENDFKRILTDTVKSEMVINKENRLAVISVIMLIISVFLISSPDRMKFAGTIEILGGNKKKLGLSILLEYITLIIISTLIGCALTYISTALVLNFSDFDITGIKLNIKVPYKEIYLKNKDIYLCVLLNVICMLIIYIKQLIKIIITSPIALSKNNRKIDKVTMLISNINIGRSIKSKLAYKWIVLSIKYYIIPMIIICAIGSSFIEVVSSEKMESESEKVYSNVYAELIGRDYILKTYSESDKFGFNKDFIKKEAREYNLNNTIFSYNRENYILENKDNINTEYFNERLNNINPRPDGRYEIPFESMSLNESYLKFLKSNKLISDDDITRLKDKKNIGIIIVDDFYSDSLNSRFKILKNLKDGDFIDLKLPYVTDNKVDYKIIKAQVIKKIPRNDWSKYSIVQRSLEGNLGISQIVLENISNINHYNNFVFNGNKVNVNKMIKGNNIYSSFNFSSRKNISDNTKKERRIIYFGPIVVNYLIAGLILVFTILSISKMIMEIRKRDFSIMRDIGASERYIISILRIETIILSFTAFILSCLIGIIRLYRDYIMISKLEIMDKGIVYTKFSVDNAAILILFSIIFITFIVNYIILKKMEN